MHMNDVLAFSHQDRRNKTDFRKHREKQNEYPGTSLSSPLMQ